ncbi:hypothetical protein [Hoeflea sp.]|uniref:hypothetical protein n=1 Tax=Hoeflea sp. TaxID=1940281 RepID=UPI002AFEAE53|nr:hypothetical protein [Hoeflea sp.]
MTNLRLARHYRFTPYWERDLHARVDLHSATVIPEIYFPLHRRASLRNNFAISILLVLAMAGPAAAGNATLKKDGKSYSLNCVNSGCFLTEKISLFKSGAKKRLGPGGAANFKSWRSKLKSQGYK